MHACGGEIVYLQGAMRDIDSLSSFLFHHSVVGKKFWYGEMDHDGCHR